MKKFVSALLVFALFLQVSACSNDAGKEKERKHRDREEQEETTTMEETTEETSETTTEPEIEIPDSSELGFIPYSACYFSNKVMAPESDSGWPPSVSYSFEYVDIGDCNFPSLISKVDSYKTTAYEECQMFYLRALEEFEASGFSSDATGWFDNQCTVYRADSLSFSYVTSTYTYAGSESESYYTAHNIDPVTGEEISILDVCDIEALLPVLFNYMETSVDVGSYKSDWQDVITEMLNNGTLIYAMAPDGIYIFFNDSDIARDGAWISNTSFKIPYINNEDILSENYFDVITEDYSLCLDSNSEVYYDLNDDGETDYVSVTPNMGAYDYFDSFDCTYNGNTISFDAFGYYTNSFVVHKNGRNFLYVSCTEDNDYRENYIFELTDSDITPVSDLPGNIERVVNPSDFEYGMRINALSTMEGYTNAAITNDGTLQIGDVFELRTTIILISAIELEGEIVDDNGVPTGESKTVDAFAEYHFYRTDGQTYIDFQVFDYTLDTFTTVRFSVDLDWDNGQQIEGMSANNCFISLYYAG